MCNTKIDAIVGHPVEVYVMREPYNTARRWQVDWKPARVTDLVDHLRDLVRLQYVDLRRAMCSLGEFQLATPFSHHAVSQMRWNAMTDDARARAFSRLMSDTGSKCRQQQRTVTSSDEQLTVTGSPRIARKKGQRRRPAAECTERRKWMRGVSVGLVVNM